LTNLVKKHVFVVPVKNIFLYIINATSASFLVIEGKKQVRSPGGGGGMLLGTNISWTIFRTKLFFFCFLFMRVDCCRHLLAVIFYFIYSVHNIGKLPVPGRLTKTLFLH